MRWPRLGPIEKYRTPLRASTGTSDQVKPGMSVIIAARSGTPQAAATRRAAAVSSSSSAGAQSAVNSFAKSASSSMSPPWTAATRASRCAGVAWRR